MNAKQWAFFRISFVMDLIGMIANICIFYFIGQLVMGAGSPFLAEYGGDYVSFVILGLAFSRYANTSLNDYYNGIANWYWANKLEQILLAPIRLEILSLGSVIWGYVRSTLDVCLYLVLGLWVFGVRFSTNANYSMALFSILLMAISVSGFGLMAASSFILINAKGWQDPIRWLVSTLTNIVSGIYFPLSVLSGGLLWLRTIGYLLPQTYALDILRRALLLGASWSSPSIQSNMIILAISCLILLPLGFLFLKMGIDQAKKYGTLSRWV